MTPRAERKAGGSVQTERVRMGPEIQSAIISAMAALVGALIGGGVTLLVTLHSDHTARNDERRAERRDAYAKYYGDAAALASDIGLNSEKIIKARTAKPSDQKTLNAIDADLDARRLTLSQDQALVVLLGRESVANAGFDLASEIEKLRLAVVSGTPTESALLDAIQNTSVALGDFASQATADVDG